MANVPVREKNATRCASATGKKKILHVCSRFMGESQD